MSDLRLKDIIFVPSIQHTGTWFVLRFLQHFIPDIKQLTFLLEGDIKPGRADLLHEHTYSQPLERPTIVQIHFPIVRHSDFEMRNPETYFERRWYSNLGTMRSVSIQTILMLCNFFKTVIPVRNPMAAILSREARHPQLRHFYIVDGFVALATEFAKHPNVKFLPIDMTDDVDVRRKLLLDVLVHCGIDPAPHGKLLDEVAEKWEPENATPGNKYVPLYKQGNMEKIKSLLGPKWAEIEYFQNMSAIILPFMASLGYTREWIKP